MTISPAVGFLPGTEGQLVPVMSSARGWGLSLCNCSFSTGIWSRESVLEFAKTSFGEVESASSRVDRTGWEPQTCPLGLREWADPPYYAASPRVLRSKGRQQRSTCDLYLTEKSHLTGKVTPAMADVLNVEAREQTGSAASRRLRLSGQVPAVLYGHGQDNQHLAIPQADVKLLLRHHGKMVELKGAVKETALVSEMHWDPLGIEVLHLDLQRVDLNERVEVTVPIHIHGEPIGTREGGIFLENQHQVDITCSAGNIPENVVMHVAELHVGENLTAGDLDLPEGVELITPPEFVICSIVAPKGQSEDEDEAESSEPEVIAKGGDGDGGAGGE